MLLAPPDEDGDAASAHRVRWGGVGEANPNPNPNPSPNPKPNQVRGAPGRPWRVELQRRVNVGGLDGLLLGARLLKAPAAPVHDVDENGAGSANRGGGHSATSTTDRGAAAI